MSDAAKKNAQALAAADQAFEFMSANIPGYLFKFRVECVKAGFTPEEAMQLAVATLRSFLPQGQSSG